MATHEISHAMHENAWLNAMTYPVVAWSTLYLLLHVLHACAAIINQTPYIISTDGHPWNIPCHAWECLTQCDDIPSGAPNYIFSPLSMWHMCALRSMSHVMQAPYSIHIISNGTCATYCDWSPSSAHTVMNTKSYFKLCVMIFDLETAALMWLRTRASKYEPVNERKWVRVYDEHSERAREKIRIHLFFIFRGSHWAPFHTTIPVNYETRNVLSSHISDDIRTCTVIKIETERERACLIWQTYTHTMRT